MLKIISFLGTGPYLEAHYQIENQTYVTAFVQEALSQHFNPGLFYIALTPTAKDHKNWSSLQQTGSKYSELSIGEAQTLDVHFDILQSITEVIDPEDTLILDITHSLRSIPMVALTAAFYLKATNKVKSLKIFYGAYEGPKKPAPIHELTSLLSIMEWVNAAQVFQRFGDGSDFAKLLQQSHGKAWQQQDISPSEKPRTLQNYATQLIAASDALGANQPKAITETAVSMNGLKEMAQQEISSYAKPFVNVFEDVHSQLSEFSDLDLPTQKRLIHWYTSRGRLIEASQLAREWMITYIAQYLGIMTESSESIFDEKIRIQAERAVGECYSHDYTESPAPLSPLAEQLHKSSIYEKFMEAWGDFIDTRNTLSHCGFNRSSQPVATLKKKVVQWVDAIDALPDLHDL